MSKAGKALGLENKMILKNTYHNTEYKTKKTQDELDAIEHAVIFGYATPSEVRFVNRVNDRLCGMSDCSCGDFWGRRI